MQAAVNDGTRPKKLVKKVPEIEEEVIIENPFEIEMCDDDEEIEETKETKTVNTNEISLDDLMSQMGKL